MKKHEFTGTAELSEKAFEMYSNGDLTFWEDNGIFIGA